MAGNREGARVRTSRLGELGALVKEGDGSWGVSIYGEPPLAVWTGSPPSKRPSSTGHRKGISPFWLRGRLDQRVMFSLSCLWEKDIPTLSMEDILILTRKCQEFAFNLSM